MSSTSPQTLSPRIILILSATLGAIVLLALIMGIIHCINKRRKHIAASKASTLPLPKRPAFVSVDPLPANGKRPTMQEGRIMNIPHREASRSAVQRIRGESRTQNEQQKPLPRLPAITVHGAPLPSPEISHERAFTQPRPMQSVYMPQPQAQGIPPVPTIPRHFATIGHGHERNLFPHPGTEVDASFSRPFATIGHGHVRNSGRVLSPGPTPPPMESKVGRYMTQTPTQSYDPEGRRTLYWG